MEFEEHEDQEEEEEDEEEMGFSVEAAAAASYDSHGNTVTKTKMSGGGDGVEATVNSGRTSRSMGTVKYRECQKNHAVSIGGHAVDGCCEFFAAGEEGTLEAVICAACNCHRNFHRKEIDGEISAYQPRSQPQPPQPLHPQYHHQFSPYYHCPPLPSAAGYLHHHLVTPPLSQHRPLALPPLASGGMFSREEEDMSNPSSSGGGGGFSGGGGSGSGTKKRFRTKFTQEQKNKMLAFAEKLGWTIQKHTEAAVEQFCAETCIKKHVLKVWMHNNKHTLANSEQRSSGNGSNHMNNSTIIANSEFS